MKKLLSITIVFTMLLAMFGAVSVSAATDLPFTQDFDGYAENATITATNSGLTLVAGQTDEKVNKTNFTAVTDNGSMAMQISLNAASGATSASSRFQINSIDTSNIRDLTVTFDYKAIGGATLNFYIPTTATKADGSTVVQTMLEATDAEWTRYVLAFDFEKVEAVLCKNGEEVQTIALTNMMRASSFYLRFSTSVNASKSHMFDNISVTTSGDTYSQERADEYIAQKEEQEKAEALTKPTKAPYIAGPDGKSVVIVKADDLTPKTMRSFTEVYNILVDEGLVGSFGAITQRCADFTADDWATIKSWVDNGFEIWHHGYKHDGVYVDNVFQNDADFIGRSAEEMEFYLNYGIDLFAEHGIKVQSVGAPYNRTDDTFIDTINTRFPSRVTSVMNNSAANAECYCLTNRLDIEVDGKTALEAAQAKYTANPNKPYYVVQCHAATQYGDLDSFRAAIQYLKNEADCVFMTPSQYIAYCEAAANEGKQEFTGITFEGATYTYDGEAKKLEITGELPEGAVLTYTNAENTEVGVHHARALIKQEGYKDLVLTADLIIESAQPETTLANVTVTADGSAVTYSAAVNAEDNFFILNVYDSEGKNIGIVLKTADALTTGTLTVSGTPASYKVFLLKSIFTMQIGSDVIEGTF